MTTGSACGWTAASEPEFLTGDGGRVGYRLGDGHLRGSGERGWSTDGHPVVAGAASDGVPDVADGVHGPPDRARGDAGTGWSTSWSCWRGPTRCARAPACPRTNGRTRHGVAVAEAYAAAGGQRAHVHGRHSAARYRRHPGGAPDGAAGCRGGAGDSAGPSAGRWPVTDMPTRPAPSRPMCVVGPPPAASVNKHPVMGVVEAARRFAGWIRVFDMRMVSRGR